MGYSFGAKTSFSIVGCSGARVGGVFFLIFDSDKQMVAYFSRILIPIKLCGHIRDPSARLKGGVAPTTRPGPPLRVADNRSSQVISKFS